MRFLALGDQQNRPPVEHRLDGGIIQGPFDTQTVGSGDPDTVAPPPAPAQGEVAAGHRRARLHDPVDRDGEASRGPGRDPESHVEPAAALTERQGADALGRVVARLVDDEAPLRPSQCRGERVSGALFCVVGGCCLFQAASNGAAIRARS